jgi:hypothetical protein
MRTEIPSKAVPVHYVIPTGFVVQVLTLKPGIEPADQPPLGNQMFAVTAAAATTRRQWLKSSGLITVVPPLSAYAYQRSSCRPWA